MKLIKYLEKVVETSGNSLISFKNEDAKINISSILKYYSKKGFSGFGKRWETLLLKYFSIFDKASIQDTNTGTVQSAFSDFKAGDIYVSLKWVENKKSFDKNLIDNFTGDTAWLLTNTTFMEQKITGKKNKWIEDQYEKDFKDLSITKNKFTVMICCYDEKDGTPFLNVRVSKIRTGKEILDFGKERLKNNDGVSQRLNANKPKIGTDLFGLDKEINLELVGEEDQIVSLKEIIKDKVIRKSFNTLDSFKNEFDNVAKEVKKTK